MTISRADFADPRLAAFLQAHLDDMEPTAPPESRHGLDLAALQRPGVRLWVATDEEGIVGTAALSALDEQHEELKSMLAHVLDDARARGVARVSLETGSMAFFAPAHALYASAGFEPCGPFGSYRDDPLSTFMTLAL